MAKKKAAIKKTNKSRKNHPGGRPDKFKDEKLKKKLVLIAVVPAFNEARFISNVIHSAKKYVDKVIVIDDGSTDDTQEIARKCGAVVHSNEKNVGKWPSGV